MVIEHRRKTYESIHCLVQCISDLYTYSNLLSHIVLAKDIAFDHTCLLGLC